MFIALMGWNVGLNAAGGINAGSSALASALLGVFVTMFGIMLPSATLTFVATQWAHKNREMRAIKAFKAGMAPIVMALLIATGWLLTCQHDNPSLEWPLWAVTAVTTLVVWRTRTHLLILLTAGAVLGAWGVI